MRRAAVGGAPRGLAERAREARGREEGEGGGEEEANQGWRKSLNSTSLWYAMTVAEGGAGGEAAAGGRGLRGEAGGGQAEVPEVAGAPQGPNPREGGEEGHREERARQVLIIMNDMQILYC